MGKFERYLIYFEKIILITGTFVLISGSVFRFISRNFLSSGYAIEFSDLVSRILPNLLLVLGIIGASAGISRNEVIKIDLLKNFLNRKYYRYLHFFSYLITSALLGVFIFLAVKSIEFGDALWIYFGYIPAFFLLFIKIIIKSDIRLNE